MLRIERFCGNHLSHVRLRYVNTSRFRPTECVSMFFDNIWNLKACHLRVLCNKLESSVYSAVKSMLSMSFVLVFAIVWSGRLFVAEELIDRTKSACS